MPSLIALTRSSLREGTRASGPFGSPERAVTSTSRHVRTYKGAQSGAVCLEDAVHWKMTIQVM